MTAQDSLISARAVAEQPGINPKTIGRWASSGKFKIVRLGPRTIRFHQSEVDAHIDNSYRIGA